MKVIFLDMDGVICVPRANVGVTGIMERLDRQGVDLLNQLAADDPETVYVLSSTWRRHFDQTEMERRLGEYGWTGRFHEDWSTIRETTPFPGSKFGLLRSLPRGVEVAEWLARHPEITEYVIIDDDPSIEPAQRPRFVQTDFDRGFEHGEFWKAMYILHPGSKRLAE